MCVHLKEIYVGCTVVNDYYLSTNCVIIIIIILVLFVVSNES